LLSPTAAIRLVKVPRETALCGGATQAIESDRTAHGTLSVTTTRSTLGHIIFPLVTQLAASIIRCCGPALVKPKTDNSPWTRPVKDAPCLPDQNSDTGLCSSSPIAQTPLTGILPAVTKSATPVQDPSHEIAWGPAGKRAVDLSVHPVTAILLNRYTDRCFSTKYAVSMAARGKLTLPQFHGWNSP
jgi:hypothetical protein